MPDIVMIAVDLAAIGLLVFALYLPRHRRRDLAVAFVGVNVGVLAVSMVLTEVSTALGIGLGLFGVLSIIRLRSSEISQREVAYYFASLAIGLICGLAEPGWVAGTLLVLILGAMAVVDHPALLGAHRHQIVLLDEAIADERLLVETLEQRLGGTVRQAVVQQLDTVHDTTLVDVRYVVGERRSAAVSA